MSSRVKKMNENNNLILLDFSICDCLIDFQIDNYDTLSSLTKWVFKSCTHDDFIYLGNKLLNYKKNFFKFNDFNVDDCEYYAEKYTISFTKGGDIEVYSDKAYDLPDIVYYIRRVLDHKGEEF